VTGSGDYVVYAGEFGQVNGVPQQGLVRFAMRTIAPNLQGPKAATSTWAPTVSSPAAGQARLTWTANYDYDNSDLTYQVFRDDLPTPVHTVTRASTWWNRPSMTFTDTGLASGSHSYRVRTADRFGNAVTSPAVSITVAGSSNAAPVARFTTVVSSRTVTADGSSSTDSDGTVTSYAWDWGDGQVGSGATANHTYASDGVYPVTLTVTDDDGAPSSTSQPVTVGEPSTLLASDSFSRTEAGGFGLAETGGQWTATGPVAAFSVAGGQGVIAIASAGGGPTAYLGDATATAVEVTAGMSLDAIPNAGGAYFGLSGRRIGNSDYRLKIKVAPDRSITVYVCRVVSGAETTLQSVVLGQIGYTPGARLNARLQVTGTAPTTVRARVWLSTNAEPAGWQVSSTDGSSVLQTAGAVGVHAYVSSSATNPGWRVGFDDLVARRI
jgi:PKD repeat protein